MRDISLKADNSLICPVDESSTVITPRVHESSSRSEEPRRRERDVLLLPVFQWADSAWCEISAQVLLVEDCHFLSKRLFHLSCFALKHTNAHFVIHTSDRWSEPPWWSPVSGRIYQAAGEYLSQRVRSRKMAERRDLSDFEKNQTVMAWCPGQNISIAAALGPTRLIEAYGREGWPVQSNPTDESL